MSDVEHGRALHRELVGMLFALAIAQVAISGSQLVNAPIPGEHKTVAFAHLLLCGALISASWVGWGWSKYGFRDANLPDVFTLGFVELLIDCWLVALYFFAVQGVDAAEVNGSFMSHPSMDREVTAAAVMFGTYFAWDLLTKNWQETEEEPKRLLIVQRGWGSLACAVLAGLTWLWAPRGSTDFRVVLTADVTLLALVFLFRAMKLTNLSSIDRRSKIWMACTGVAFAVSFATLVNLAGLREWLFPGSF